MWKCNCHCTNSAHRQDLHDWLWSWGGYLRCLYYNADRMRLNVRPHADSSSIWSYDCHNWLCDSHGHLRHWWSFPSSSIHGQDFRSQRWSRYWRIHRIPRWLPRSMHRCGTHNWSDNSFRGRSHLWVWTISRWLYWNFRRYQSDITRNDSDMSKHNGVGAIMWGRIGSLWRLLSWRRQLLQS